MAVTTLTHSQSHSDDDADDDDDDDPGPARKPLFLHTHRVAHHRPHRLDKARPSVQWKGRGRPAVGRVARLLLLAGGLWPYLLPPPPMGWSGLVWSVSDLV